jgi:hypothetical protein
MHRACAGLQDRFSKYDTLKTMKGRQAEAKLKQKQKKRR